MFKDAFRVYNLINYAGVVALVALAVTFALGVTGANFRLHKAAGIVTFVFACVHGGLVMYRNLK